MTAGYTLSLAIVRDTFFGWQSIFVFYAVSGFALFGICWWDLGETKQEAEHSTQGSAFGPIVLLQEPLFWPFALCGMFSVGTFYIFLMGAPLVARAALGVTTAELGFYIGSITLGFLCGSFIPGRFGARCDPTTMIIIGRVIACAGLLAGSIMLLLGHASPHLFFASTIFVGFGNGVTMPASNAGVIFVRSDLSGSAAGLNGALIVAGGAVLTAVTGSLINETSGAQALLLLMLLASGAGLCCALWAAKLQRTGK
ncbi:MAG: MFS transporter [Roseobacter sp.]